MWNGETKPGACKECIKRFRGKEFAGRDFPVTDIYAGWKEPKGTALKMNTRPIFICDHI